MCMTHSPYAAASSLLIYETLQFATIFGRFCIGGQRQWINHLGYQGLLLASGLILALVSDT